MMKNTVLTLLVLLALSGCDSDHPLKLGYEGMGYDDPVINEAIKKELNKRSIEYYTFVDDGREVIAYPKEHKEKVISIRNEVTGGPPNGYTGHCYETQERAVKQQQLLENNQISSIIRDSYAMYCVYWEKENNDKVAEIDQHFKEIRAHQKEMGNEI
ncbi:MAG: hypothetical protein K1563_20610 [Candidatus Thiodiazotropha sp. (ex. Lucinisca nassula)]|nr:hypothetical protein [Candidatus Thiodiazotropha sp. (ex. Lucinisca nassula)]